MTKRRHHAHLSITSRHFTILLVIPLLMLSGCKTKQLPGQFATGPILIDGKTSDWSGLKLTHFEDHGFSVGIANDTSRLYLMMRTHDGSIVRTIRMTGMQLWMNSVGEKETGFGVKLRGGPSFGMSMRAGSGNDRRPPGDNRHEPTMMNDRRPLQDTALMFTFIDEDKLIDLDIPPDGSLGPAMAIDTSEGFYTYEFSIPLQESEVRFFGLGSETGDEIALNVNWGEIDREEMRERMGGFQGGIDGGGPPMGGGMPEGGVRGGPPGGLGQRPEIKKVDIWFKTLLASH